MCDSILEATTASAYPAWKASKLLTLVLPNTQDRDLVVSVYRSMHILAAGPLRTTTLVAILSGGVLAVLTRWGLFRFNWIIAKQLLSIVVIGIGLIAIYQLTLKGVTIVEGDIADGGSRLDVNNHRLLVGAVLQMISLFALYVISVFKPWGERGKKKAA
ncbi:hypothetical protein E5161_01740 [Cohnella pontilimi]|uniref:Uncharacterized protein n=1 Tax=Cohnella pontilimi TaxID=2564100 RepID=A0A4U0FGL5_9BACL|nr:hypothetical protein [Cohnella pontilimi]TJY44143.1 hypothetical protein E5161_01740 [Cohnella pontilimi]